MFVDFIRCDCNHIVIYIPLMRSLLLIVIAKSIVEVAYNTQYVIDNKHNLIVHTHYTNTNDSKALHKTVLQVKQNLQFKKEDNLMVLADNGYYTGAELLACQQYNIITQVAYREQPSVKHIASEFLVESFTDNKLTDTYTCAAGVALTSHLSVKNQIN